MFSQNNVDHYFVHMRVYKMGKSDTACKVDSALQWYCNFCYNNSTTFTIESSPDMLDALWLQKSCGRSTGNPGSGPLKGLMDAGVLESDHVKMMNYMYRSRNDWDMASINFAWGYQGVVNDTSKRSS
jgi:hypothetical protein